MPLTRAGGLKHGETEMSRGMKLMDELREQHRYGPETYVGTLCNQAANEIAALRAALSPFANAVDFGEIRETDVASLTHEEGYRLSIFLGHQFYRARATLYGKTDVNLCE